MIPSVRYFKCESFHGLFVPPNKARLNLSGDSKFGDVMFSASSRRLSMGTPVKNVKHSPSSGFGPIGTTPNHLDRIENLQMDFSAVKDISDSFGNGDSTAAILKTPTSNVKSQNGTPATNELKSTQNEIYRLRDQIMSIKSDLGSGNRDKIDQVVNKLSGMLETYEQVSNQYENQLKQFLMARKASKLDSSSSDDLVNRLNQEKSQLLNELENIRTEYEKVRNNLYTEIKENDSLKGRFMDLEDEISRIKIEASQKEEEFQQKLKYENDRNRTESEIESVLEAEQRKRTAEHEKELSSIKMRHDEEIRQKKLLIADLQNEVAFLKQSEKVLEEELNSRRYSSSSNSGSGRSDENSEELFNAKRQVEEFKRLWEDAQAAKMRSEEYYRGEIERARKEAISSENEQFEELKRDLKELGGRLKQTRADNEELAWALETSRKECERLNGLIEEQAQKLSERERKLLSFSERIQQLESRELESREADGLQAEIRRLKIEIGEEKAKATGPLEQINSLKRKILLIEREKELLEEQVRTGRLSAYSQGEFQTFSSFIQGLKRHIEAEILSIEPLKLTLQDVVRAKEMVDILLKVTEDVRIKVLTHLSQVEDVIRSRFSQNTEESIRSSSRLSQNASEPQSMEIETVKIERVRNFDPNNLSDLKRRIDFRPEPEPQNESVPMRTLREPLGITSIPGTSTISRNLGRSGSNDYDLDNRIDNFRNTVTEMRLRSLNGNGLRSTSSNINTNSAGFTTSNNNPSQSQSQSVYAHNPSGAQSNYNTSTSRSYTSGLVRAHEPIRCNLCQEYGHDALTCPDYLSGTESFSEDVFLRDLRNSKFNSRFSERTRV